MSFKLNPLLNADSYKFNHINMGHREISEGYSNFTPRSVSHLVVPEKYKTNEIVWFGGQAVIRDMVELWDEYFFALDNTKRDEAGNTELDYFMAEFSRVIAPFVSPTYTPGHWYDLHAIGHLPLKIKTLPEGSRVKVGIPVVTVRNTHPKFGWLTNFIESYLSAELWKMSTSATIAGYYRDIGNFWYEKTGANKAFLDFAGHDFSYRGMSGTMDAIKSSSSHLIFFKGTDCVPAIPYLEYHYSGKLTFIGASVPATEHSIQTAFVENDLEYFRAILKAFQTGIVSIVADGYDYWSVLTNVLPQLKDEIMARQPDAMGFAKVVIRPDSGNPIRIIAGYKYVTYDTLADAEVNIAKIVEAGAEVIYVKETGQYYSYSVMSNGTTDFRISPYTKEEIKGSIQLLWELFGGTLNEKGYKTLDSHIGLIYGDSITLTRAEEILQRLEEKGFSADNVVFGIGSYTYQFNTRDTLGFAMKMTNIVKDGKEIALFKDPKTDNGTKKSAKGLLSVVKDVDTGEFVLWDNVDREMEENSYLTTLYEDGKFYKHETLEEIRNRVSKG